MDEVISADGDTIADMDADVDGDMDADAEMEADMVAEKNAGLYIGPKKHLPPQLSSLCLVLEKINPAPPLVG